MIIALGTASALTVILTGCGAARNIISSQPDNTGVPGNTVGAPGPLLHPMTNPIQSPSTSSSAVGIQATLLPGASVGGRTFWSPSGNLFAYPIGQGTYVVGTLHPFHIERVSFGSKASLVAVQDTCLIVADWSYKSDIVYPLNTSQGGNLQIRTGRKWTAPTDTWQEWVVTKNGPAIETGGYQPNSVSITFSSGKVISLGGGQVYVSADRKYGAVASRPRAKRTVHPVGDVEVSAQNQPSDTTSPIQIWDFAAAGGPKQISTLHLPAIALPKKAGSGMLQTVVFSPDDKTAAVLVQGEFGTGPKLNGATVLFDTKTGKLLAVAPYGNGLMWFPNSTMLWLGTPMPEGQGNDRIISSAPGTEGQTVSIWPEAHWQVVLPIEASKVVTFDWLNKVLQVSGNGKLPGPTFTGLPALSNQTEAVLSPNSHAAIAQFDTTPILFTW